MDIRQLRYFAAVAQTGHLTRAAAALGIQQPPLTQQLHRLESEVGLALFERHPKGMAVIEAVDAARLHAGLIRQPVAQPPGLVFETLLREPMVLAFAADHALAKLPAGRSVPIQKLHEEPLILVRRPGAPGLYARFLQICERSGAKPRVVAEVERMMTGLNLVAAGAGITVVPASMSGQHPQAIQYRRLQASVRLDAPLTLVTRKADTSPLTRLFCDRLRSLARQWPA